MTEWRIMSERKKWEYRTGEDRRTNRVTTTLSDKEYAKLCDEAARRGQTVAAYVRDIVLLATGQR